MNDYKILQSIISKDGKGLSRLRGVTLKEMSESTGLSLSKVKQSKDLLISNGYIAEGVTKVRAKTYYITNDGINELKDVKRKVTSQNNGGKMNG